MPFFSFQQSTAGVFPSSDCVLHCTAFPLSHPSLSQMPKDS
jgi:hypothetical protein